MGDPPGAGQTERQRDAQALLYRRILNGASELAQLWFAASVLDKYRGSAPYKIQRTDTVGRIRGPQWTLDFGIAGSDDSLLHLSAGDAATRIPEGEREHWAAHAAPPPASANFLMMQLTRGACIDDGDVRSW